MDPSVAGGAHMGGLARSRRPARPAARAAARSGARPGAPAAGETRLTGVLLKGVALALAGARALHRRRRLRITLLAVVVCAPLLVGGWRWLRHSSLVAVRHVHITGVSGPDAQAVQSALEKAARRMSTLDVHVGALRAAVAPFRVVREVRASASFPHGVRITVSEQLPVAALSAGGTRTAAAANGVVLGPALLSGSLPAVAARSLPAPGRRVSAGALAAVLAVLGAAPARLAPTVTAAFSGPRGVTLAFRSGLHAYFGDAGRAHAKWLALSLVLAGERLAGVAYVDVRVPERAAVGFGPGGAPPARGAPGTSSSSSSSSSTVEATGTPESIDSGIAAGLAQAEASGTAGSQAAGQGSATGSEGPSGSGSQGGSEATGAGSEGGH